MRLTIEQLALYPPDPVRAKELLGKMGLTEWVEDQVMAEGFVFNKPASNIARLSFNYQAAPRQLELEVLNYRGGDNWMVNHTMPTVSHVGMHCSAEELVEWRAFFKTENVPVVQEVITVSHTNPAIAGLRRYNYVIFGTRYILGVDIKFIVRLEA